MGNSPSPQKLRANLATKPTVIIVGGGYGGVSAAGKLDTDLNVILIDKKNHFFHNIGALRPCVNPKITHKALVPYDKLLTMGAFIQGTVTKITEKEIVLAGYENTPLKFDYCIIATGSEYAFPMKNLLTHASDVQSKFDNVSALIEKANDITIVGGGPVGLELLGEIGFKYPKKNIRLIQSNEKILPGDLSDGLRNSILQRIKDHFKQCQVITGERVNITDEMKNDLDDAKEGNKAYLEGEREIKTSKGNKYKTDLIFFATGARIKNSSWNEAFKDAINNENGRLKVKNTLQVEGFDKVFAIGDCADAGPKMGYFAEQQGELAAANIIASAGKKGKMKTWGKPPNMMFVPLGPEQGAAQLPIGSKVVGATMTSKLKGASLFYDRQWQAMGQGKVIPNKVISLTPQEINSQLTDEDFQRLSKGVQLDEKVFRDLVTGNNSNENSNVQAKSNDGESKESKENDAKESENKANENNVGNNNNDNNSNDNNENNGAPTNDKGDAQGNDTEGGDMGQTENDPDDAPVDG